MAKDNLEQLDKLHQEVSCIAINGVQPPDEWYDNRIGYIVEYSNLNWTDLSQKFYQKDQFIYEKTIEIQQLINRLIEERAVKRAFNIPTYHLLLYNIKTVWNYYNTTYICGETDIDVVDLVEGMKFL